MIPAERAHLHVAARTHPGMTGKINEDRYAVSAFTILPQGEQKKPIPAVFVVVADGIGGHKAGEVAAQLAVELISKTIAASDGSQPETILRQAIIEASQAIFEQSEKDLNLKGMGATCACAWVVGDRLYTASVGDSRIYLIRGAVIRQVSTDHTWIQEALENGSLTPEEAVGHPNAHVIRRYLGSKQPVIPDLRLRLGGEESDTQAEANQGVQLQPGDQLLLCSDGLTDLVKEDEILSVLKSKDQERAMDALINLANQRGGHDNITIVSLEAPQAAATAAVPAGREAAHPTAARRPILRWIACLGAGSLILAVVAATAGLGWFFIQGDQEGDATRPAPSVLPGLALTATSSARLTGTATARPVPTTTPFRFVTNTPATLPARTALPPTPTLTPWPTNTRAP